MGSTHIEISHIRPRSPSVASQEDDLHEHGVHVSPVEVSPPYSVLQAQSQSGSSSHPGEKYVHLPYPSELHEAHELRPSDSASRLDIQERERGPAHPPRSKSARRLDPRRTAHRESGRRRRREPAGDSQTESGDSTEEFLSKPDYGAHMPRPQSYYGPNGYTQSSSSGSYGYAQMPPSNQMIHVHHQPIPPQYPVQYPPITSPPQMGFPPPPGGFPPQFVHAPPSQVSSPYTSSPYAPPSVIQYGAPPSGYFPNQYPMPYPPQQYPQPQQYPHHYQQHMPPMNQFVDMYRVSSPPQPGGTSANSASTDAEKAKSEQEEILKKFEALMKAQTEEKKESQMSADQALQKATEKFRAEAAQQAERMAAENRIREEARLEAIRAYEDKARAAAELAAREQQIRKEAADAALKAAAEEAAAKAERAALEKKIAEDAAAAAKTAAEKDAAEAAAAAKEEAKKQQDEAEKKLKEAEEAAAKAKADAEAAEKKAADAAPPEKQPPVRFKDAIGRNYNFPWERCRRWRDMEGLIHQAFAHIEGLADHVINGHYDLLGPDKEIIMPNYWESTVEPDMHITMMLWPLPEPKKEDEEPPVPPDLEGGILSLDDILNPKPKDKKGKKKSGRTNALSMWMMGGGPSKSSKHLKGDKKPDLAAVSQHGSADQDACTVM